MPKLQLIVRGAEQDHKLTSPPLTEEEAKEQLSEVSSRIGAPGGVSLPWATVPVASLVGAHVLADDSGSSVAQWQ